MIMRKFSKNVSSLGATFFLLALLSGCATGSSIITGNTRPAVLPTEVRLFLSPPAQFEVIGLVEARSEVGFSRQNAQDRTIENLKRRAGRMGANGILLTHSGDQQSGSVGTVSSGIFFTSTTSHITARGQAIFVIQE